MMWLFVASNERMTSENRKEKTIMTIIIKKIIVDLTLLFIHAFRHAKLIRSDLLLFIFGIKL